MQETQRQRVRWPQAVAALAVAAAAWLGTETQAAERSRTSQSKASGSTEASVQGESKLAAKLDQVLANQDTILQRFDDVMEELRIIKVRATLN